MKDYTTKEIPISDLLASFDKELTLIEATVGGPERFEQLTVAELRSCLDVADKIHAVVSRFKITVGIVLKSKVDNGEEQPQ